MDLQNDFTHGEALRTPMFWVCSLSISLYGLIAAGISLFNESILVDQGFQKEVYYESLAMGTGIAVVAKLCSGFLGIYWPVNRMLTVALLLLAGSLAWLTQLASYQDVVINAVAGGMLTVLFFSAWPDLYGRAHLGKIQGSAQMLTVLASAIGPLLFAESRESAAHLFLGTRLTHRARGVKSRWLQISIVQGIGGSPTPVGDGGRPQRTRRGGRMLLLQANEILAARPGWDSVGDVRSRRGH